MRKRVRIRTEFLGLPCLPLHIRLHRHSCPLHPCQCAMKPWLSFLPFLLLPSLSNKGNPLSSGSLTGFRYVPSRCLRRLSINEKQQIFHVFHENLLFYNEASGIRTPDNLIKSQVLYRLS